MFSIGFLRAAVAGALALLLPAGSAIARGAPDSFADLANQLLPTVVNIATTETLKPNAQAAQLPDLPPDSELQQLFKGLLDQGKNVPRRVTSLGSGFVIDPSGLIVTNYHVIDQAEQITVTLNDGTSLPARVVGSDEKTDLALLRVKPAKPLPSAHFGDSNKPRVGDWVVAIGNPFGLGSTVTAGIVSARNRDIAAGPYDDFIQTDAPINRGNSGGPLFDMDGNVVGINSVIYSPSGGSVGIGFAIPSNMARQVVDQIEKFGATRRGWIGVRIQGVTDDIAESMSLPNSTGALVAEVTAGGPAAKAGLLPGDVVESFDGKPVPDSRSLPRMVADTPIGKTAAVEYVRGGQKQTARVTVAKLEDDDKIAAAKATPAPTRTETKLTQLGFSLGPLDAAARAKFHVAPEVQGVVVTGVDPDSAAGDKNFQPGDVIVEVQNQPVRSPDDVSRHLDADTRAGKKVELLLVNRGGNATYVAMRLDGTG
ncbi:MAG TPA: DegQ family serine endoprotease [Rhizomicrobium sp.]|nr:DegQ family serine endoprotease [Rhizomicrobium sp.]